jgi:GNAT superfamily N-acetyltransferase
MYEELQEPFREEYQARISQFLVLPCYQKKGYAKILLDGIYRYYQIESPCNEIGVEKPTKAFASVRD